MDSPQPSNTLADLAFEGRLLAYMSLRQRLERDKPFYPLADDPEAQSGYFVTDIRQSIFAGKASPEDSYATRLEQFKRLIGNTGTVDARNMMDD